MKAGKFKFDSNIFILLKLSFKELILKAVLIIRSPVIYGYSRARKQGKTSDFKWNNMDSSRLESRFWYSQVFISQKLNPESRLFNRWSRVCHEWRSREMITFESLLTTFEASNIFWGSWGSSKIWLEPKTELSLPSLTKLICPWHTQ